MRRFPDGFVPLLGLVVGLGLAPIDGPGARADDPKPDYPHAATTKTAIGTGPKSYTLFEPARPKPERAPVVVFLHGWLAMNPGVYGAWIEHLVRSGHVVIFPRYMETETPIGDFLPNALSAIGDALDVLQTSPKHVRPDRERFALVGHSTGGMLSARLAAGAAASGLPEPRAIVVVTPGEILRARGPSLAEIPPTSLLVVVAAEHDTLAGDGPARQVFREATSLRPSRKRYVLFRSDLRGRPALWADHVAPTAALAAYDSGDGPFRTLQMSLAKTDAFDRQGFWKVADAAIDAGFARRTLDDAIARGASFGRLGFWSDGRPVLDPLVADDADAIPRVIPAHGIRLLPWPEAGTPRP